MSFMPFTAGSGEAGRLSAGFGAVIARPWRRAPSPRGGASAFAAAARRSSRGRHVATRDVVFDDALEVLRDGVAAQRDGFLAVDEHRRGGCLASAGQADADVGVLALAGAVDDAAHDRDLHRFDAGVARLP